MDWNSDQTGLYLHYAQWAQAHVAPRAAALWQQATFDHASWNALSGTDLWRMVIPIEYGGLGSHWMDFSAAMEGLASQVSDGGFLLTLISQAGFLRGLALLGTPEQKARLYPRLLAGELTATAIAEDHSGTDVLGVKTTAIQQADQLHLTGSKWNIAHAPTAGMALVVGKIPALGKRSLTLFLLENADQDWTAAEPDQKMGNRTLPTAAMRFEQVSLPQDAILGKAGDGMRSLAAVAGLQRIYYGWLGSQLLRPLLQEVMTFLEGRTSRGQALLEQQYVQGKITDALVAMEQSRWAGLGALSRLLTHHPQAGVSGSVAKLTGMEASLSAARGLLSLLGSNGYQEGRASRLVQDLHGWLAVGGTEEAHRINIFNQFIKQYRG